MSAADAVFVDTFYWLALINPRDAWHDRATSFAGLVDSPLVTTDAVLLEVADALSAPHHRAWASDLLTAVRTDDGVDRVPLDKELFDHAADLYAQRPDKDWSMTDCVSFVVMGQRGIRSALTGDVHFVQAGFRALLREDAPGGQPW